MTRKLGGNLKTKSSETRSETLKGRESQRKNKRQLPRSQQLQGRPAYQPPDPDLKPWPIDCVILVAATPATVNVRGIRGRIIDRSCQDCTTRLAVDSQGLKDAIELPQRQGRPVKIICVECCLKYDRSKIDVLKDLRSTTEATEVEE
jgi:hypothetical protein